MKINRNSSGIARNTILLTAVSVLGVVLSFVKEAVMAYYFGASEAMDAYVVAVDLPIVLFSLISVALGIVLVPNYVKIRLEQGDLPARRYFCNLYTILAIIGVCTGIFFEVTADYCVQFFAPGLSAETKKLAVSLFRIVVPATVVLLLVHATTSVMNAHKCFAAPALGEPLLSIVFIVIVVCSMSLWGIYAAAIGTFLGAVIQIVYVTLLRKKFVGYRPIIDFKDVYLLRSIRMAGPVLIGTAVSELNKVIDKAIASMMDAGSISALHYAAKISSGITNVLISGIFTVYTTEFAERAAEKDDEGMAKAFNVPVNGLLLIAIPLFVGGVFLQDEIIKIVYGRGAFDENVLHITAPCINL